MFLYVIYREYARKIGLSSNPKARAASLGGHLEYCIECPDDEVAHAERRAHDALARSRWQGEWFFCGKKRAIAAVKEAAEWTKSGNRYPLRMVRNGSVATSKHFSDIREAKLVEAAKLWGMPRRFATKEAIATKVGLSVTTIEKYLGSREQFVEKGEDIAFKVGYSVRTLHKRLGTREDARLAAAEKAARSGRRIRDA